ncbi:hypothetical protein Adt_32520 [Abeliophyllum distichum]|uniref:Uncharacterized protein n=1 Tax=Abeliophyllum distichum TaxID=126358 RepID=A0ABD1QTN0_9LAMI
MQFVRVEGNATCVKGKPTGKQFLDMLLVTWQHEAPKGSPNTAFKISAMQPSRPFRASKHGRNSSTASAASDTAEAACETFGSDDFAMADVAMHANINNAKADDLYAIISNFLRGIGLWFSQGRFVGRYF